jgi:hypothetical protein
MLEELDATPKSHHQINSSSKNKTIRNKLRKPKKTISFHQFSRRLPVNTTHVFVVRQPPSPPPPTPLRLIASMQENPRRKVSSSTTTPSFSFLQAILDLSEQRKSPEIDEQKREEEAISRDDKQQNKSEVSSPRHDTLQDNLAETSECQCCCLCCCVM